MKRLRLIIARKGNGFSVNDETAPEGYISGTGNTIMEAIGSFFYQNSGLGVAFIIDGKTREDELRRGTLKLAGEIAAEMASDDVSVTVVMRHREHFDS